MPGPVDQLEQAIEVAQDQVGALVGGEAAGEADRQRVRVEQHAAGDDLHRVDVAHRSHCWRARSRM